MSLLRPKAQALRVLLVVEDGDPPHWLSTGQPAVLDVERLGSLAAAFERLAVRDFDLIIGRWSPRWNKWLATHAPAPPFVHPSHPETSLLAAAARGLAVYACGDQAAFQAVLRTIVGRERQSPRMSPVVEAEVRVDDVPLGMLADFAHTGLSVLAPLGTPLSGLACDRVLTVTVEVSKTRVLEPSRARVIRVDPSARGYLVALAFIDERRPPLVAEREITEPTRIEALLRSALDDEGLGVESLEPPQHRFRAQTGSIDPVGRILTLDGAPVLDPLSLVEVEFEVSAVQFSFTGVVVAAEPLQLRLPRRLEARERRLTERRPSPSDAALVFEHPLLQREISVPVIDLSPDGLGLEVREAIALPIGLRLDSARLVVDGQSFPMRARVRRLTRLAGGAWRCGVSVSLDAARDGVGYASLWLRAEFPQLEPGERASASELMALFQRTGTAPAGVDVAHSTEVLSRLHRAPPSLHRSLVLRRNGELVAHVSAIRRYRSLWTVQHLTSIHPDRRAPFSLLRAGIEVSRLDGSADFVHGTYAVSNAWSARTMGSGLSGVDGAGRWALPLRHLSFFGPTAGFEVASEVDVRAPGSPTERLAGEAIIAALEPALLMQAYEWQASQWSFDSFSALWREAGLERTRTPLVAVKSGVVVAVALLERSTRALNFREDLSAARVWVDPTVASADRRRVLSSLLARIGQWYLDAAFAPWPLITTPNEEDGWLDSCALAPPVPFVEATTRMDAVHSLSKIWAAMAG